MVLNTTDEDVLVDRQGRPYFLWDTDMPLEEFRRRLDDPDPRVSGYVHGKLMRQAKPDDVFLFTTRKRIRELWPHLDRYLGHAREFWHWIFTKWEEDGRDRQ